MIAQAIYCGTKLDQMTWDRSIKFCEKQIAKDKEHGHKLLIRCGVNVRCPDGKGRLVHKEYLYYSRILKRDVWMIKVLIQAREYVYNDAGVIHAV